MPVISNNCEFERSKWFFGQYKRFHYATGWIQRWAMYLAFCWEGIVFVSPVSTMTEEPWIINLSLLLYKFCVQPWEQFKGGSRYKNLCMTRVLGFLIRFFSNYYTLHRSDLAARAALLDPRLNSIFFYITPGQRSTDENWR